MKVLLATGIFTPEIGGPATYAKLLSSELPKRGIEVDVLPFREVRHFPKIIRHVAYAYKVFRRSKQADVIFTQDPVSTGIPVIVASALRRRKVIMRVAGDYAWEQSRQRFGVSDGIDEFQSKKYSMKVECLRFLEKWSAKRADVVITPSNYFNRLVSGWLGRSGAVKTIYNGIEVSDDYEKGEKFPERTIISAGRLVPWKGFDTLIKAMSEMPGWKLLIAGDGPDKDRLGEMIKTAGLEDRVTLLGNLGRRELFSKIYKSHVFALLSTFESFSFQVVEAMSTGTPVIAADIGNLSEIIENGKNGILVEPNDISMFKKEAERLISDKDYASRISNGGKARAMEFSIEKTLDHVVQTLHDTLHKK